MHTATPVPPSALEVAAIASAVTDDSRSTTSEALVDDLLHYTGSDVEMGYESADLAPLPASNVSLISTAASSEPNPNPHSLDPPSTSDRKISSKRPSLFRQCHNPLPDTPRNLKRIADHASAVVQDERRADSAKETKEVAGQAVKLQVKEMPCDEGGKQQEESVLNVTTKQNRLDNSNGSGSGAKRRRPESVDTGPASRQDSQAIPVDKSEGAPMAVRYPSSSVQPMDKQFPMEHFSARGKDNKGNTTSQDANEFTGQGADKNYGPRRREWHNEDLPRSPRPRARRNRYYHLSAKGRARDDRDPSPTPPDHQTDYHKNSQDGDKDTKGHTNKPRKGDIGMQFSDRTPSSPPPPAAQAEEVQHPPDSQPLLNDHSPTNAISQQSDTVNSFPTPQNGNATLSSYACVDSPADPTSVLLPATATYRHPPLNSIPVPGLWFEKVGLDGADILEVEFDVDPETAAYWRLPDANR